MLKRLIVIPLALALTAAHSRGRTDEVLDWNAIMSATVAAQNPFAQARFAAITQLAVFEAVNACTERYRPYLGAVAAPAGASAEAAAVAAAHAVLEHYFPRQSATLDAARGQSLAAIEDGGAKANDPFPIRSGCRRHSGQSGWGVRGNEQPASASSIAGLDWEVKPPDRCPAACSVLRVDSRVLLSHALVVGLG